MNLVERANSGLHDHIVKKIKSVEPRLLATVADIGCGTGALLSQLRGLGYQNLTGLDIAPPDSMDGIQFVETDLDAFGTAIPSQSLDLAIAVEVIEHIENPGVFFAEISRILAPDGRAIFTTPNVHSIEARLRFLITGELKQFDRIGDPTHIYPVFRHPFELLLARHGLSIVESWGFPENGSSPTSRRGLRLLASAARKLGVKGTPSGDQLCMILRRTSREQTAVPMAKRAQVTAHY